MTTIDLFSERLSIREPATKARQKVSLLQEARIRFFRFLIRMARSWEMHSNLQWLSQDGRPW